MLKYRVFKMDGARPSAWLLKPILLLPALVIAGLFVFLIMTPNPDTGIEQANLEAMFRATHRPPNTWAYSEASTYHKRDTASVSQELTSNLNSDEIRLYYDSELKKTGWRLTGEKPLRDWGRDYSESLREYCKGPYSAHLHFAGKNPEFKWTYAFGLRWGVDTC